DLFVPRPVGGLVLNADRLAWNPLFAGGGPRRGERFLVARKGFREGAAHPIGPPILMLDDSIDQLRHDGPRIPVRPERGTTGAIRQGSEKIGRASWREG